MLMDVSVCWIWLCAITTSFCTLLTVLARPFPSTTSWLSRTQFGLPWASTPMMPFAHIATWSFVSSNQARSSLSLFALARELRPPFFMLSAMIFVMSVRLLLSVTFTISGWWTLSW